MPGKFEILTKYIDKIGDDAIGVWFIDKENDGTPEHPIQMPYVNYSELVNNFINDVYSFIENNKEMELTSYGKILNENGIEWGTESMQRANLNCLDARCISALIVGAVRAERFCDGALLNFFKNGTILKWLLRLKELDE